MATKKTRKIFIVEGEDENGEDNREKFKVKTKLMKMRRSRAVRDSGDPPGESGTVVIDQLASHRLY